MTSRLGHCPRRNGGRWRITSGRMCWMASVCFCAAEDCWAQFSTASPNRPAWETATSSKRTLSTSLISTRLSQRWCFWTTNVDIASPRDCTVTFITQGARSTLVQFSFECLGLVDLQDRHGMQGRSGSARHTGVTRFLQVAAFGGQVHHTLHLENVNVSALPSKVVRMEEEDEWLLSGRKKRDRPLICQLLMHFREERNRGRAWS